MTDPDPTGTPRFSILFVCSGNTCRSVMAEALARRRFGADVRIESAGLRPQAAGDARAAIDTLRVLYGIDASSHTPRSLASVNLAEFDLVVAMDHEVATALPPLESGKLVSWRIDDPWDDHRYHECAREISQAVSKLHDLVSRPL